MKISTTHQSLEITIHIPIVYNSGQCTGEELSLYGSMEDQQGWDHANLGEGNSFQIAGAVTERDIPPRFRNMTLPQRCDLKHAYFV